jgi:hypothetical protein
MNKNTTVPNQKPQDRSMDTLNRCIKTAYRIIKGENVCPLDNSFLYEKYPGMHLQAWSQRADEQLRECESDTLIMFINSGAFGMSREVMMEAFGF